MFLPPRRADGKLIPSPLIVMETHFWFNQETRKYTTVPHHPGDMPEGTLRAILRQAGIDPEDFLKSDR